MSLSTSLRLLFTPRSSGGSFRSCLTDSGRRIPRTHNVRHTSSKGKGPDSGISKAPEMNFDHTQGNTILHQKAKRAAELHSELNQLLDKQAKRRADEMNRPFGAGFLEFMKKSKSEMINIFASFFCVCLAYQIYGIRKGARKLLDEAEEHNKEIDEYKKLLRVISSNEFHSNISQAYENEVKKRSEARKSNNTTRGSGWLSRNANSDTSATASESENILSNMLKIELEKLIGDVALTDSEIQEKRLAALQSEMDKVQERKTQTDSLGGLEQIIVDSQSQDSTPGQRVLKRTGFI